MGIGEICIGAYQQLNKGKRIRKKDITREHIVEYDSNTFWKTVFNNGSLNPNCKISIFIDTMPKQIINSERYLKYLLNFGNQDGFSDEDLQPIAEDHKTLCSYLSQVPRKGKKRSSEEEYTPKESQYKACNGF